jgi:hypothetical protein
MRSSGRLTFGVAVALAALALAVPAGAVAASTPSPQSQANRALAKLARDTGKLPKAAAGKQSRRALAHLVKQARRSAVRKPCQSVALLRKYRRALQKRVKTLKRKGARAAARRAVVTRGALDAQALAANVALMALPRAKKCGGGKRSTVDQVTTTVGRSDERQLKVHVAMPKPEFVARRGGGQDFQQVLMEGMGETGDVGKPALPQQTNLFGVPVGADVSVHVDGTTGYDVKDVNLYPHQKSAVDISRPEGAPPPETFFDPPFTIDRKAYAGKTPFPGVPADGAAIGSLRGLSLGGVDLAGGQYNPKSDTLHVFTSVDVTIDFGGSNQGNFGPGNLLKDPWNARFFDVYRTSLINFGAVAGHLGDITVYPFCGEEMLVVTSPGLQPAASTFAAGKNAQGISTKIALVGSDPGQIGATNTAIQAYIRHELTRGDCLIHPTYVVLFGNTAHVPTFLVPCGPGGDVTECNIASDLPYSLDGIGTDLFADVMLGRIPAPNIDAANAVVTKILNYETTPPAPPGDDFYRHATVTGYFQPEYICVLNDGATGTPNCDGDHPPVTGHWEINYANHQDTRGFTKTAEAVRNAMAFNSYNVDRLYTTDDSSVIPETYYDGTPIPDHLRRPTFAWNANTTDFLNAYNGGRFLILHRDHGWPDGWADPTLHSGHVPLLTNGSKLPVVFGINCASGAFDDPTHPSFVELQVMKPDGGAFAGFGDTRVSPSFPNNHITFGFFDALFPNLVPTFGSATPTRRLGDVLLSGKAYMATQEGIDWQGAGDTYVEHYLYHLLGDPSGQMWAAEPQHFDPTRITTQYRQRAEGPPWEIFIQLPQGGGDPPPEGTILTLLQNGEAIGRAIAGPEGTATVVPAVQVEPKNLSVAFDQDGVLPAQDGVDDTPPPPPPPAMETTCPSAGKVQGTAAAHGTLTNAPPNSKIQVKWTPPGQPAIVHDLTTDANGNWTDRQQTNFAGTWTVAATYVDDKGGSTSGTCSFDVT